MIKKDAIIFVRFLTTSEGGRQSSIETNRYGCPLMIDDTHGFDCRFVLNETTVFELGREYEIAVSFLHPESALEHLSEGDEVYLWEGKKIGEGAVKTIFAGTGS